MDRVAVTMCKFFDWNRPIISNSVKLKLQKGLDIVNCTWSSDCSSLVDCPPSIDTNQRMNISCMALTKLNLAVFVAINVRSVGEESGCVCFIIWSLDQINTTFHIINIQLYDYHTKRIEQGINRNKKVELKHTMNTTWVWKMYFQLSMIRLISMSEKTHNLSFVSN